MCIRRSFRRLVLDSERLTKIKTMKDKRIAMPGAISGGIVEAFYKEIPDKIAGPCFDLLPDDIFKIVEQFQEYIKE